jgi:hypothetical protein
MTAPEVLVQNTLSYKIVEGDPEWTGTVNHDITITGKIDAKITKEMDCRDFIK